MKKSSQHVVPSGQGKWSVKKSGSTKASKVFETKAAAEKHAVQTAKNQKTELYIHRKNGTIESKKNYAPASKAITRGPK